MKKLKISKFDLGYIIAFVVVTALGIGAWLYLSGQLQASHDAFTTAQQNYLRVASDKKFNMVVTTGNVTTLKSNIDLIKEQIDPLVPTKLQNKDNHLSSIKAEDPVAWKHDLDDTVTRLKTEAKNRNTTLPNNFEFGFSRYQGGSPGDEQTAVLGKQLVGMDQIVSLLLKAPVTQISAVRRTYEEEDRKTSGAAGQGEGDRIPGFAAAGPNNSYIAYPFEVEFITSTENLRTYIDSLLQSPYVLIVRSVSVKNSAGNSPQTGDLSTMAGGSDANSSSPTPDPSAGPRGPQYLFGNSSLTVKMRIDLIEWTADLSEPDAKKK